MYGFLLQMQGISGFTAGPSAGLAWWQHPRRQFAALVRDVDASEIAAMEQRLIAEGMSPEEVKRLCDVHVKVFQESIESGPSPQVPEGHPVHTFMAENRALERILARLEEVLAKIGAPVSQAAYEQYATNIDTLFASLRNVHVHYLRKENQLFPLLERHAITGPTQVMWSLDDDIRGMIKTCISAHGTRDAATLKAAAKDAIQALRDMIYKEERILFPMSLETLCDTEWDEIRAGEGDIGYAWISPSDAAPASQNNGGAGASPDTVRLDTGALTVEQINLMLTNLPIDLSFVNEHDEVRYYSATRDRIFPRSPAVIGRTVQNCHPPKSMPRVQEILDAFRAGTTNEAEFWIQLNGAFIHIRYFALRDAKGSYRGCLEVSQDVTAIRALAGERRLLE